jgi:hypothetical protein
VNDIPRHLSSTSTHSIIPTDNNIEIALQLKGIISYFPVRTPTTKEINNCQHIVITLDHEELEDKSMVLQHQEFFLPFKMNTQNIMIPFPSSSNKL